MNALLWILLLPFRFLASVMLVMMKGFAAA